MHLRLACPPSHLWWWLFGSRCLIRERHVSGKDPINGHHLEMVTRMTAFATGIAGPMGPLTAGYGEDSEGVIVSPEVKASIVWGSWFAVQGMMARGAEVEVEDGLMGGLEDWM